MEWEPVYPTKPLLGRYGILVRKLAARIFSESESERAVSSERGRLEW